MFGQWIRGGDGHIQHLEYFSLEMWKAELVSGFTRLFYIRKNVFLRYPLPDLINRRTVQNRLREMSNTERFRLQLLRFHLPA